MPRIYRFTPSDPMRLLEISDPSTPAADSIHLYARDNNGNTELAARFPTGEIERVATGIADASLNVEDHGAVPMIFGSTGQMSVSSSVLTDTNANFAAGIEGQTIVVYRSGSSTNQALNTTIASRDSATQLTLAHTKGAGPTSNLRYRYGEDSTSAMQSAIDDAETAGGGRVSLPGWYVTTGLNLGHRVRLDGPGKYQGGLLLASASNRAVVRNKTTADNFAQYCGISNMTIQGARKRQTGTTTGTVSSFSGTTLSLSSGHGANFTHGGTFRIGSQWFLYVDKSGDQLLGVITGREGTTASNPTGGQTVTQYPADGFLYCSDGNTTQGTYEEDFDAHWFVEDCYFYECGTNDSSPFGGWAIHCTGRSEGYARGVHVYYCNNGINLPFDTWCSDASCGQISRIGFKTTGTSTQLINCKGWYCGTGGTTDGGWGLLVEPTATQPIEGCCQVDFNAQDCYREGAYIRFADRVTGTIRVSSNSQTSADGYAGVRLEGGNWCALDIISTERKVSAVNQKSALQIDSSSTFNSMRITHGHSGNAIASDMGPAIKAGSSVDASNNIQVAGQFFGKITKIADQNRTGTTTLADDDTLLVRVAANQQFIIRGKVFFDTIAAGDFKYGFSIPASPTLVRIRRLDCVAGGTPAFRAVDVANVATQSLAGTGTTGGYVEFVYLLHNGANAGNWAFQWAQDTSDGSNTTVRAGSYIEVCSADPA
jgi:hypothetical protein